MLKNYSNGNREIRQIDYVCSELNFIFEDWSNFFYLELDNKIKIMLFESDHKSSKLNSPKWIMYYEIEFILFINKG